MRGHQDSPQKLERKDRELELSDVVLVASRFTESTLRLGPKIKAQTIRIPFGCSSERMPREKIPAGGPLRVLFVGALDQRKGLTYLFDAVEGAEKWLSLTVIGTRPHEACAVLDRKLQNHRWISTLPHARVLEEMSRHDVLVFPSLFEGFGLVIVEALSQGLPVITTDHTAGPDVITDGREGFIVPIRDVRSIREKLEWLAADASRLESMREAAYARAAQLEWTHYRSLLRQHLQPYIRKS
jgi:glycosyltransferase involved in cell wall biosynthesis